MKYDNRDARYVSPAVILPTGACRSSSVSALEPVDHPHKPETDEGQTDNLRFADAPCGAGREFTLLESSATAAGGDDRRCPAGRADRDRHAGRARALHRGCA